MTKRQIDQWNSAIFLMSDYTINSIYQFHFSGRSNCQRRRLRKKDFGHADPQYDGDCGIPSLVKLNAS